jgi:integrase/recombinase XerD
LGLRHADFVSHRRELRIVPRADNANGARAKTRDVHTIPIPAGLARLYTAYMFDEYGECESDYVFVNLFAEPYGRPLRYQAVHQLVRTLRARTGIEFSLHMLRHYVNGWVMWPARVFPLAGMPRMPIPAT